MQTSSQSDQSLHQTYYCPQTKLLDGNVVTPVGDSVHVGGGSLSEGSPGHRSPLTENPWTETPPPDRDPPSDRDPQTVKSRRYASYWNAFLLFCIFTFKIYYGSGVRVNCENTKIHNIYAFQQGKQHKQFSYRTICPCLSFIAGEVDHRVFVSKIISQIQWEKV